MIIYILKLLIISFFVSPCIATPLKAFIAIKTDSDLLPPSPDLDSLFRQYFPGYKNSKGLEVTIKECNTTENRPHLSLEHIPNIFPVDLMFRLAISEPVIDIDNITLIKNQTIVPPHAHNTNMYEALCQKVCPELYHKIFIVGALQKGYCKAGRLKIARTTKMRCLPENKAVSFKQSKWHLSRRLLIHK